MIIVMGIPGAGKTSMLEGSKKFLPEWKMLNYGDLMFEIASKEKLASNRDEMRKMPVENQKKVQKLVAQALASETGKLILDTHCSIYGKRGYLPGLPFELLKEFKVEQLVLVLAPEEDIIRRRKEDTTRIRDQQSAKDIANMIIMNRAFLCAYSAFTGAPAQVVMNGDGKLEEAVGKFVEVVKG
ncbi:MAG: adenylate kinase [Candidatus Micrarchaeota archaeon]